MEVVGGSDATTYNPRALEKVSVEMSLEGTDNGVAFIGSYFSHYLRDVIIGDLTIAVRESILTISGVAIPTLTGYYQGSIYGLEGTARDCYVPEGTIPEPAPTSVTVGYQSPTTTLYCTDGATAQMSYRVESAGGDNATFVGTSITNIGGVILTGTDRTTYTPNMEAVAYTGSIVGGGLNINMSATSISQW